LRIGQNVLLASRSRAFLWGVRSAFARIEESGGAGSLRNAGHRAPQVYVSALPFMIRAESTKCQLLAEEQSFVSYSIALSHSQRSAASTV
jgi:hypothetical protein